MRELIHVSDEVRAALEEERAVVALETTLVAHGFPAPTAWRRESRARPPSGQQVPFRRPSACSTGRSGSGSRRRSWSGSRRTPASSARAISPSAPSRAPSVRRRWAARSPRRPPSGSASWARAGSAACTGAFPSPPDVSADLAAAARIPAVIASSGIKSLLDVPATMELLETLGVPVIGFGTDTLPLFYDAAGGPPVSARVDDVRELARSPRRTGASVATRSSSAGRRPRASTSRP